MKTIHSLADSQRLSDVVSGPTREGQRQDAADGAPRRQQRGTPLVMLLPAFALLLPLTVLFGAGWLAWRAAFAEATSDLRRSAEIGAEYGSRALQGYVASAGRLNERLRGLSDQAITEQELRLHRELQLLVAEDPQLQLIYVLDREGRPRLSTSMYPAPTDASLADRDYFQELAGSTRPDFYVSTQFLDRFDQRLLFTVARPRAGSGDSPPPDGGFDGVVALSIEPNVLAEGLRRLIPVGDILSLLREEGDFLSRSAGQEAPLPRLPPSSPFHTLASNEERSAVYESVNFSDGSPNLVAMHRLDGFKAYAVAMRPRAAIVADWRARLAGHMVFGVPATLALLLLSLRVRRDQLRLAAANDVLERDVEHGTSRLTRAAQMGLVGTFEFDLRTGVSTRSGEYMSVAGHAAAAKTERHEDWVSRLHPDDRVRAEKHLLDAISDTSGILDYAQTYRIITPQGDIRWIAARGEVERDAAGRTLVLRGAHFDVTPLRETQMALAESDARLRLAQEAVGIGTWEWYPAGRTLTWSSKMVELWGFDPAKGQPPLKDALARLHPLDGGRLRREMAAAHRSGLLRTELRILRPRPGLEPETVWLVVRARILSGEARSGKRLVGVAYDVTERKAAEEHARLLAHEVEHRAKNMLTVISGLVRVTRAETHEEYVETLGGRIQALAGTLSLLGQHNWKGTTIGELFRHELQPFITEQAGDPPRATLCGPEVLIDAEVAQMLSIAIHELTTNAAKYGALSEPQGHLEVCWSVEGGTVRMTWRETGGPLLAGAPESTSFGSQLITHSFTRKLGGEIEHEWLPSGLVCRMSFSLVGKPPA